MQQRKKCAHIISTISTSHTTTAANTTLANTADGADSVAAAVNNVGAAATAAAVNNGGGAAAAAAAATVANVATNHTAVTAVATATALHGSQCSSPGSASAHPALSRRRPWQTTHIAASEDNVWRANEYLRLRALHKHHTNYTIPNKILLTAL